MGKPEGKSVLGYELAGIVFIVIIGSMLHFTFEFSGDQTVVAFIFSDLTIEQAVLRDLLSFTFFSILTIIGIWTSFRSNSKLRKIRKKKKIIRDREATIIKSSKAIHDLLCDCIYLEDDQEKGD